jgi:hypothetical protein
MLIMNSVKAGSLSIEQALRLASGRQGPSSTTSATPAAAAGTAEHRSAASAAAASAAWASNGVLSTSLPESASGQDFALLQALAAAGANVGWDMPERRHQRSGSGNEGSASGDNDDENGGGEAEAGHGTEAVSGDVYSPPARPRVAEASAEHADGMAVHPSADEDSDTQRQQENGKRPNIASASAAEAGPPAPVKPGARDDSPPPPPGARITLTLNKTRTASKVGCGQRVREERWQREWQQDLKKSIPPLQMILAPKSSAELLDLASRTLNCDAQKIYTRTGAELASVSCLR